MSIGSSKFDWALAHYNKDTETAIVKVTVTDRFDFHEGDRPYSAEQATTIGRRAELTEYDVRIQYNLVVKVKMPDQEQ